MSSTKGLSPAACSNPRYREGDCPTPFFWVFSELRIALQSKLFSKVGVAPRLATGKFLAVVPGFASRLNAVENALVTGAAAEMSGQPARDGIAIFGDSLLQHRRSTNQNSGNAETALHSAFEYERVAKHAMHVRLNAL